MKRINYNTQVYYSDFEALVERKHDSNGDKARLKKILPKIEASFDEFNSKKYCLENVFQHKGVFTTQKAALMSCFSGEKFQRELYSVFLGVDVPDGSTKKRQYCCYCQERFSAAWDHFLPASTYAYFSAYPPNLVRACVECNSAKSNKWVTGTRETLHPYFDDIDGFNFLECTLRLAPQLAARFKIVSPIPSSPYIQHIGKIAELHFKNYGLDDLYGFEAARKIGDLVTFYKSSAGNFINGEKLIKNYIVSKICELVDSGSGINEWELVLYLELFFVDDICNYLI